MATLRENISIVCQLLTATSPECFEYLLPAGRSLLETFWPIPWRLLLTAAKGSFIRLAWGLPVSFSSCLGSCAWPPIIGQRVLDTLWSCWQMVVDNLLKHLTKSHPNNTKVSNTTGAKRKINIKKILKNKRGIWHCITQKCYCVSWLGQSHNFWPFPISRNNPFMSGKSTLILQN